ncbi:unnamed protein product [Echinostoma caproni]|uniref:G_PROTEIN_RECEP_F1_2 domain-containing protein n=1 Tax=Echinostoma caproni TaxID=27848 RepID=A0A183BCN7_9TREM|nr:unnamed protein product [Echinostoma caproni]
MNQNSCSRCDNVAMKLTSFVDQYQANDTAYGIIRGGRKEITLVPLMCLISWTLIGNGCVVLTLCRNPTVRTLSNLLVGHLALVDFLIALLFMTVSAVNDWLGVWPFSIEFCIVWINMNRFMYTASVWSSTSIAIDRYVAIAHAKWHSFSHRHRRNRMSIYLIPIWTVSLLVCGPSIFLTQDKLARLQELNERIGYTVCTNAIEPVCATYSISGSFFIPIILTTALYARMIVLMRRQRKGVKNHMRYPNGIHQMGSNAVYPRPKFDTNNRTALKETELETKPSVTSIRKDEIELEPA